MPLTSGQKLAIVGAAGIGAFFLFGGSAKAGSSSPKVDPCVDPKDCATLSSCAAPILASATAADIPKLNDLRAKAVSLSCSSLISQIDDKIKSLGGTPTGGKIKDDGVGGGTILFSPSNVKDKQRLINDAWTLARMGPLLPSVDDATKYHLGSDNSFGSFHDAYQYSLTGRPIVDVKTGAEITRSLTAIVRDLQDAAGLTVDGDYGTQSNKAFAWALSAGNPTSIGGDGVGCVSCGGEGCSACDRGTSELGQYNVRANYRLGSTAKIDRAYGTGLGAGPRGAGIFGGQSLWWPNRGTSGA